MRLRHSACFCHILEVEGHHGKGVGPWQHTVTVAANLHSFKNHTAGCKKCRTFVASCMLPTSDCRSRGAAVVATCLASSLEMKFFQT